MFCQFCGDYDYTHTRYPGSQPGFRSSQGYHVSVIFCQISLQLLSRGEDKGMAHLLIIAFFLTALQLLVPMMINSRKPSFIKVIV